MSHNAVRCARSSSRVPTNRCVVPGVAVRQAAIQTLEKRVLMAAQPIITEFMAKNGVTLTDGYGENSDWIEVTNVGDAPINLAGWHLTDSNNLAKWTFPTFDLAAGQSRLVFASSRDTTDPAGNLHTNFSLSQDGEKLALTRPDLSIASRYRADGTNFPAQLGDVSYGIGTISDNTTLVGPRAPTRALVPTNGALDAGQWTAAGFNDASWLSGPGGVGFDTGGYEDNTLPPAIVGRWDAGALGATLTTGQAVNAWTDSVGGATAFRSGSPFYVANAINGHGVVRFNPADGNDLLRIPASASPMAGNEDFTVVVVFRANGGIGSSGGQWTSNAGLVDASVGGTTNDWGLSVSGGSGGRVAAGVGAPDTTLYTSGNKANGQTHVAIFSREDGQIRLFVDGGDGLVAGNVSAAPRGLADLVFGGLQTNANYFNGDIAEVRVYDGAMNAALAYGVASNVGNTYNFPVTEPTTTIGAPLTGNWTADALNASLNDNDPVTGWASSVGTRNAVASGSPRLVKGQLNGHSVIRFDPADGADNLRVSSGQNPLSNVGDFSVAVVFRTSSAGVGDATQWYNNTGLIDGEIGGITNDWGLAIDSGGRVGAGIGNPDATLYSAGGNADGQAHVAIYSKIGDVYRMSIDGGEAYEGTAPVANRNFQNLVFGSIQTNINYFTGDIAEVRTYGGGLDPDAARSLAGSLADKYGITLAPGRYDSLTGIDLEAPMFGAATTALVRTRFTVDNPAQFDRLTLSMQYDDGFVAYLNGVEIARRNATGTITYTSVADGRRLDTDALTVERIDVSAFRNLLVGGGATNVLAVRALNSSLADPDLLLVPQLIASKVTVGEAYMSEPTPGAPNGEGFAGFVPDLTFSAQHGLYNAAFDVTIAAAAGATIVYTLDGSEPTLTNGTVVPPPGPTTANSVSVDVDGTTTLRAVAFKNLFLPSRIATQTYVLKNDVLTQGNVQPPGAYWDTEVDPQVVNNTTQEHSVLEAIESIPSMSLVLPDEDMFGPTGIYPNPRQKGRQWERETSVEYFDPNDASLQFQIDAGIRIQGGSSRDPARPKKSFRLYFRTEYGASSLEQPLFGAGEASSFDHLILRAGNNYSWPNEPNALFTDYLRDEFARNLAGDAVGFEANGRFVNLYINGLYWGVYNVVEEPDERWAANNFGGDKDFWDVMEPDGVGGIEVKNGNGDAYFDLFGTADAAASDGVITNAEYDQIANLVDIDALVGFMLTNHFRGDRDAPALIGNDIAPRNFYAFHHATEAGSKVIFQTWDGELAMDDVSFDRTELMGNLNPARLFKQLRSNVEFQQVVADKVYALYFNGGPLDTTGPINKPLELYNSLVAKLDVAIVGESARWGDSKRFNPFNRDGDWLSAVNWMRNTYLAQRPAIALGHARNDFPTAQRVPASFLVNGQPSRGGNVSPGSTLTLVSGNANPAGDVIYYTLDGSDPRLPGGNPSPAAQVYNGTPITLAANRTVTVRTLNNGVWTARDSVQFTVIGAGTGLRITELAFDPNVPAGGTFAGAEYEFVELLNTNNTPLNIGGYAFNAGITYTIPAGTTLQPGEHVVVVGNLAAFQQRYGNGPRVVGEFAGSLANEGETLTLVDGVGGIVHSFAYVNRWYPVTQAGGHTLVIRDALADKSAWATAAGWRPSQTVGGSPAATDVDVAPVVTIAPVVPSPRNTAVGTITITFSEPVVGFDLSDLSLTRSGGGNLLTGSQTLTTSDGGKTWTLGNLAGLMTTDGAYALSVATSGVADLTGRALAEGTATTFTLDRAAPASQSAAFLLTGSSPQVRFDFGETLIASAALPVLTVTPVGGGAAVTITGYAISGTTITFDLPATLADANYTAVLTTPGVRDAAGNDAAAGAALSFGFLAGDLNGDRTVGFADLVILAQNYGQSGRPYAQGNINFSAGGTVDFADLVTLAQKYGQSLPMAVMASTPPAKKTASRDGVGKGIFA